MSADVFEMIYVYFAITPFWACVAWHKTLRNFIKGLIDSWINLYQFSEIFWKNKNLIKWNSDTKLTFVSQYYRREITSCLLIICGFVAILHLTIYLSHKYPWRRCKNWLVFVVNALQNYDKREIKLFPTSWRFLKGCRKKKLAEFQFWQPGQKKLLGKRKIAKLPGAVLPKPPARPLLCGLGGFGMRVLPAPCEKKNYSESE